MALPWTDMKIAFPCPNPERLWRAVDAGKAVFPNGIELNETDCSGANCVAIFRVSDEAFVPSCDLVIKGREIRAIIRKYGR